MPTNITRSQPAAAADHIELIDDMAVTADLFIRTFDTAFANGANATAEGFLTPVQAIPDAQYIRFRNFLATLRGDLDAAPVTTIPR